MKIWWKFEDDQVIFTVDCYANNYVSVGFGKQMKDGDIIVIQFVGEKAFLSDRHGLGHIEPVLDA